MHKQARKTSDSFLKCGPCTRTFVLFLLVPVCWSRCLGTDCFPSVTTEQLLVSPYSAASHKFRGELINHTLLEARSGVCLQSEETL